MSVIVEELEAVIDATAPKATSPLKTVGHWLALAVRCGVGVFLCTQFLTSLLVVGWTFRWMRSRTWRGWWKRGRAPTKACFCDFACSLSPSLAGALSPRWVMAENVAAIWLAPRRDGRPPSIWNRLARLPSILFGSLALNLATGLSALASTLVLTLPGAFLMLAGWKYGWDNSFFKGYEQTYIGRIVFAIGLLAFVAALTYVPMAWAHMAAAGDPRAFFQGRLVRRLIRARLGWYTFLAVLFVIFNLPWGIAWVRVYNAPNEWPGLETATPEALAAFTNSYVLNTAFYVFLAFVLLHLVASRIYQGALLALVAREPKWADELPASIRAGLENLRLLPPGARRRRHPLVAAVLGTTRRGTNAVLWGVLVFLWLFFAFQMITMQFLHYHDYLVWLNPVLVHLPCPRWSP